MSQTSGNSTEFLGFKVVKKTTYDQTQDKNGYIWFVRDKDDSGKTLSSEIYLGDRKYGNVAPEIKAVVSGKTLEFLGL